MKRILIIEDEPQMRKNLQYILEQGGYAVDVAADGRAGMAKARQQPPDLILCDVMMPEVDGYGVLGALRADPATQALPFIFLTAKGDRADIRAGMNLGADDYLTKPVGMSDLLEAVTARLARSGRQAERRPSFASPVPLEALGLLPREAEVLFQVAQGKATDEIAAGLGGTTEEVKGHLERIFEKLAVESRAAATLCALSALSASAPEESEDAGKLL